MKTTTWVRRGTICLALLAVLFVGFTSQTTRAQCGSSGSDDFNDNSRSTTNWGPDLYYLPMHAQLTETNGRLEYTTPGGASSYQASRPWVLTYGSYLSDWEAQVDINLGGIVLTQNQSHVELGFSVFNEATGSDLSHLEVMSIVLDLFRNSSGQVQRDFSVYFWTNGAEVLPRWPSLITPSQKVGLRINFECNTKTLVASYDEDGGTGGYHWTPVVTNRIDTAGFSWNMNAASRFQVAVGGSSGGIGVGSGDQVFADNFAMTNAPCYSRFIQVQEMPDGNLALLLEGNGHRFDLEASTNLPTGLSSWAAVATLTNGVTCTMDYVDTTATNYTRRFYRAALKEP
jgi:hypothetical protein